MTQIEFDPAKDAKNRLASRPSLGRAADGDWATAYIDRDTRRDYGEPRFYAYLLIERRVHVVIFAPRGGKLRIISLRKANQREVRRYERLRANQLKPRRL